MAAVTQMRPVKIHLVRGYALVNLALMAMGIHAKILTNVESTMEAVTQMPTVPIQLEAEPVLVIQDLLVRYCSS